jgi:uncharacterized membrane protein YeaQ/YmgE (transglycosylase-associated protein family)
LVVAQIIPARFGHLPGPTLTFGFILATLVGAAFHLIVGGDARRLALFLLSGWIGFTLGHLLGVALAIDSMSIGPLHVISAMLGALVALIVAQILTANQSGKRPSR